MGISNVLVLKTAFSAPCVFAVKQNNDWSSWVDGLVSSYANLMAFWILQLLSTEPHNEAPHVAPKRGAGG